MSFMATAIIGSSVVGGVLSSRAQTRAARSASQAQQAGDAAAIAEQRRQFDAVQQLLAPYIQSGNTALTAQQALIGLAGPEAQQQAITALEQGPEFNSLVRSGEDAIRQSASATGGLRGGNIQDALAKYRPEVLAGLINQQYGRLGDLSTLGQNAAVGQANAGQQTGANVSNLLSQQGASQAGYQLARGQATADLWGNIAGSVGLTAGLGGFDGLGNLFQRGGGAAPTGTYNGINFSQFSDIRLKENVERIGTRSGHNWYRFRYVWDEPGTIREGVMAHEIMATHPEAVGERDGFLTVDYRKLGIEDAAH